MHRGKTLLFVLLGLVLCTLAAIGGYKGSRYIADSITVKAEENAEKAGLFKVETTEDLPLLSEDENENPELKSEPVTLIYVADYETGKIVDITIVFFNTVKQRMFVMNMDPDISYTMTGQLYRSLANENVLLPQTVKVRELYGYYGNDAAFPAGKKIISELLGKEIDYYIAYSTENVISSLKSGAWTVKSAKEMYEPGEDIFTDMREIEAKSYSEMLEMLSDGDISEAEAPVIKRNENSFLDVVSTWQLITNEGEN